MLVFFLIKVGRKEKNMQIYMLQSGRGRFCRTEKERMREWHDEVIG